MRDRRLAERIEKNWLESELVFANTLARLDPSWGTVTFDLADGAAVLCGPGLFVNRALGVGITGTVTTDHLVELERRANAVGVTPEMELTDLVEPSLPELLISRGYEETERRSVLVMPLDGTHREWAEQPEDRSAVGSLPIIVEAVDGDEAEAVALWQDTAAIALEITNDRVRRASDLFAKTASEVDDPGLMVARALDDNRPLGCATLKIHEGMATLGGMSTIPAERRKGVQAALVTHRLREAADRGCAYAISSAETGSTSERNLIRRGFTVSHNKMSYTRS